MNDRLIYAVHAAFWAAFGITLLVSRRGSSAGSVEPAAAATASATAAPTAPYSRALLGLHMAAFGVLYFGIGAAVLPNQVTELFAYQRQAGVAVMALGAFVACWALL